MTDPISIVSNVERFLADKYYARPTPAKPPLLQPHEVEFVFRVLLIGALLGAGLNMVLR